jgi:hypothetical protein
VGAMENKNITIEEKLFEAVLKVAADEALREEMEALPDNEELNKMYPRTKSMDKKAYAVINREQRAAKKKKTLRILAQIAAGCCIFIVASGIVLISVEASRNYILNYLIDMRGDYVAFEFGTDDTSTPEGNGFVFGYLPEGFELINSQAMENFITYIFTDETGHIIIFQRYIGDVLSIGVDTEYTEFSEIQLDGKPAYIFEASDESDHSMIMWEHGNDVISVSTSLEPETLIIIAENLRAE